MLEEYIDNRRFINKTPKGKVLRWKLFLQGFDFLVYHIPGKEIHQTIPDALSRLCANLIEVVTLSAIDNKERIPGNLYRNISAVHNSEVGHMGLQITKDRLNEMDQIIYQAMPMLSGYESGSSSYTYSSFHMCGLLSF